MLGARCVLELSEVGLSVETLKRLESTVSGLSKDACSYNVSVCYWGWNQDHAKSLQLLGPEKSNPHSLVQAGSLLVLTPYPWTPGKYVIDQQNAKGATLKRTSGQKANIFKGWKLTTFRLKDNLLAIHLMQYYSQWRKITPLLASVYVIYALCLAWLWIC